MPAYLLSENDRSQPRCVSDKVQACNFHQGLVAQAQHGLEAQLRMGGCSDAGASGTWL